MHRLVVTGALLYSSNKKRLGTSASLLVTSALLVVTRSYYTFNSNSFLLLLVRHLLLLAWHLLLVRLFSPTSSDPLLPPVQLGKLPKALRKDRRPTARHFQHEAAVVLVAKPCERKSFCITRSTKLLGLRLNCALLQEKSQSFDVHSRSMAVSLGNPKNG